MRNFKTEGLEWANKILELFPDSMGPDDRKAIAYALILNLAGICMEEEDETKLAVLQVLKDKLWQ